METGKTPTAMLDTSYEGKQSLILYMFALTSLTSIRLTYVCIELQP